MKKLIKINQPIDYYIIKHTMLVQSYFMCMNGKAPKSLLYSIDLYKHIQKVIYYYNDGVLAFQTWKHLKNLGSNIPLDIFYEKWYKGDYNI